MVPAYRMATLRIRQTDIDWWKRIEIDRRVRILRAKYANQPVPALDDMICSALVWCGAMWEETHDRDALLRGITALETISNRGTGGGIGKKFREYGTALIYPLSAPISDTSPQMLRDRLKALYESRCNISHGSIIDNAEYRKWTELKDGMLGGMNVMHVACQNAAGLAREVGDIAEFFGRLDGIRQEYFG